MKQKCLNNNCLRTVTERGLCKKCTDLLNSGVRKRKAAKPIKKESDKRKQQNKEYFKIRAQYLKDNPKCAVCSKDATEIHHTYSGTDRQKYFLISETWLSICRMCHIWIHNNPLKAREQNLLK